MTVSPTLEPCDLCGGAGFQLVLEGPPGRAMLSDRRQVAATLRKIACETCGLVRSDRAPDDGALEDFYRRNYRQAALGEHLFYTPGGTRTRSAAFVDWMMDGDRAHVWQSARRILEVGSGHGGVLRELTARLPRCAIEGQELHADTAATLRRAGYVVHEAPLQDIQARPYDVACSIAVVEHVRSPTAFLRAARRLLRTGGTLFLTQPTQDVCSTDLFLFDHVHHFTTAHVAAFASRAGFVEAGVEVGHEAMPNFSLHTWKAIDDGQPQAAWHGPPAHGATRQTANLMMRDFERLDRLLADLRGAGRPLAVFGLAEVFALLRTYTNLGASSVAAGLIDGPAPGADYPFPVMTPEAWDPRLARDVLLAINRVHYPLVRPRLERLGFVVHEVLSDNPSCSD